MTGMVEKVARALCIHSGFDPETMVGVVPFKTKQWCLHKEQARAAIEAMRVPSRGMIDAAYAAHDAYEDEQEPKAWCGLSSAFTAMFDHALKDEGQ